MREDFLHYIWMYQKFNKRSLTTVNGEVLEVVSVGDLNTNSGPDFLNSKIIIGNQKWFGRVEIHLKASDWFKHKHQDDVNYNNVILHVVWENDIIVYDVNNNKLETLVLKDLVDLNLLKNYRILIKNKTWINCENEINTINEFTLSFWKQKLLLNRLSRKVNELNSKLLKLDNNWESLLYQMLAKNFGLKINAIAFELLANNIPFSMFRREFSNQLSMEALLFGQSNLLNNASEDLYSKDLQREYMYLKQKYNLQDSFVKLHFFRLRPSNFPTVRLSQFSMLYFQHKSLFSKIISSKTISELYTLFKVSTAVYWQNHYVLGKESVFKEKFLSNSFIDLLILNTIIPLKYAYAKSIGVDNIEELLDLYKAIKPEVNSITTKFKKLKLKLNSSLDTQSLIELKNQYCNKKKCLQCEIGNKLLYTD